MADIISKTIQIYDQTTLTWKDYPIIQGKSAYESYLDVTTDIPKKTEAEWLASLQGKDGIIGVDGKSAYQSYLDTTTDNPKKTEAEWIASLQGKDGIIGVDGKSAYQSYLDTTADNPKKTEAEWIASFGSGGTGTIGEDGKSAYQSYLDTTIDNPKLTEVEWLASLQGDPGIIEYTEGDVIPEGTMVRIKPTAEAFKIGTDNITNGSITKEKLSAALQTEMDNESTAASKTYDNTISGSTGTNCQTAIDELFAEKFDKANIINNNTVNIPGFALDAMQANPNIPGGLGALIASLTANLFSSGEWTPTLLSGGSSISIDKGQWFKIGRLVFLSMATCKSAITSPNTNAVILSIPFPAASTRNYGITGYNSSGINFNPLVVGGGEDGGHLCFNVKSSNGGESIVIGTSLPNAIFQFSITYIAT